MGVLLVSALLAAGIVLGGCGGDDDSGGNGSQASDAAQRWQGTFDSTFGQLTFKADGDHVTGDYEYCGGHLEGTAVGDRVTGEWTEDPQACGPGQARGADAQSSGSFEFTLTGDGSGFNGIWRYANGTQDPGGADWEGARISASPAPTS